MKLIDCLTPVSKIYEGYFNDKEDDIETDDFNQTSNSGGFYIWTFNFEPYVGTREAKLFADKINWNKIFAIFKMIGDNLSFVDNCKSEVLISCGKYSKEFGDEHIDFKNIQEFVVSLLDASLVNNKYVRLSCTYCFQFFCSGIKMKGSFANDMNRINKWIQETWNYYDSIDNGSKSISCDFQMMLQECQGNPDDVNSYKEILTRYNHRLPSTVIGRLYDRFNGIRKSEDESGTDEGRAVGLKSTNKFTYNDYPLYCRKLVKFLKKENGEIPDVGKLVWKGIKYKSLSERDYPQFMFYLDTDRNDLVDTEISQMIYDKCFSELTIKEKLALARNGKNMKTIVDVYVGTDLPVEKTKMMCIFNDDLDNSFCEISFYMRFISIKELPSRFVSDTYKVENNEIDIPF